MIRALGGAISLVEIYCGVSGGTSGIWKLHYKAVKGGVLNETEDNINAGREGRNKNGKVQG